LEILKKVFTRVWLKKIYPDGDIMDCMYVDDVCTKARFRGEKKWTIYKK
jgi:hypothetical protein